MADLVAELADQAKSLPAEERSRLVELLLESLHEPPIADVVGPAKRPQAAWTLSW
jgi:hypothetical protein